MPRTRTRGTRIYTKGKGRRFYGDFRDLGGSLEALKAPRETLATQDPDVAAKLAADRVAFLTASRKGRVIAGAGPDEPLAAYCARHLELKERSGRGTAGHLKAAKCCLLRAAKFFGAGRPLATITPTDIQAWIDHLSDQPVGRTERTLGGGAIRHHLNNLSNVYKRAQSEGVVVPGFNPVALLMDKPHHCAAEARWLEVHEAALLLEACRRYVPRRGALTAPLEAIVATFLLTGGRKAEVLGLEVDDVHFARRKVTFRVNAYRRLKTATSARTVELWPQLAEILGRYLKGPNAPAAGGLLFPPNAPRGKKMIGDFRKALDGAAALAGWRAGEVRTKMFRHTYCTARLQTLDRGRPIAVVAVARELGHGGLKLVNEVYGHLSTEPHRSEHVEYRPEAIRAIADPKVQNSFAERLRAVRGMAVA